MTYNPDWRGEWLSLKDLSKLLGKSYGYLRQVHQGYFRDIPGIRIHKVSNRIWYQVDRDVYNSLL